MFVTHSLGEAVFLADRVAVFSARPGRIKEIIAVDEPHPRKPAFVTTEKFSRLRNTLYELLHEEIRKAVEQSATAAAAIMSARRDRRDKIASRAVQIGFVVALIALWYLGTAYWGISRILLPNPVNVWTELKDVLASGEYLPDLRVTLTELAIAFAISCTSRRHARLSHQPLAISHQGVRAAARRLLFGADHPVPAALRAVLRARPGIEDRARHHHQLLPDRAQHDRGLRLRRQDLHHRGALDGRLRLADVPLRAAAGGACR